MAKFSRIPKLSPKEQQSLLIEFCKALVELKTPIEAAQFIKDLLSQQEAGMLAKRIAIARMLIDEKDYSQINARLKVSYGTIARISHWLATSGEGYRLIVNRVKPEKSTQQKFIEELEKPVSWKNIKRKYASYFWPEILLEEIVKTAKKKQKERLHGILGRLDEKSNLFKNLSKILKEEYAPKKKQIF